MTESEIQSNSPDGRYCVQVTPWEARNTLWVYTPEIIDTELGARVFVFEDHCWSSDRSTWLSATDVEFVLRKYPGDRTGKGVSVIIDCARRVARYGEGPELELSALELTLDAMLARIGETSKA